MENTKKSTQNVINGHCILTIIITLQYLSQHIFFSALFKLEFKEHLLCDRDSVKHMYSV